MPDEAEVEGPEPDTDEAVEFLRRYFGPSLASLTAIHPDVDGAAETVTFRFFHDGERRLRAWIDERQGRRNIYFMVNPPTGQLVKKAKKEHVRGLAWLHVDIDPRAGHDLEEEKRAALSRLLADPARRPTVIIDSGAGLQAMWRLSTETALSGDPHQVRLAEAYDRQLAVDLEGDLAAATIERVMRLPGTINLPNASKRKKGRGTYRARLVEFGEATYELGQFRAAPVEERAAAAGGVVDRVQPAGRVELAALKLPAAVCEVIRTGTDPTDPQRWSSTSEPLFWATIQMLRQGVAREKILSVLLDPGYAIGAHIRSKHRRDALDYATRQIERAAVSDGLSDLPPIYVDPSLRNLSEVLDRAEDALKLSGSEIYQQEDSLVRLVLGRDGRAPRVEDVRPYWLLERMVASARWLKRTAKSVVPMEVKLAMAQHYIDRGGDWRLPRLRAVVTTPSLRRDLTLLSEPGHDEASELYYDPMGVRFSPPSPHPHREEAEEALAELLRPLRHFPFVPDSPVDDWEPGRVEGELASASRSVAISMVLTGLMRPVMRSAPLHAVDAPAAGTGKGKVVDYASVILSGARAPVMTMTGDETEDTKSLFSALRAGPRMLSIDNVDRPIQGAAICSVLTQEVWKARVLGVSRMDSVPTNVLMTVTGNNLVFRADVTRRVVLCRMDPRSETPEDRPFEFDPVDVAHERRPELVRAALTVLLGYAAADRPLRGQLRPVGSFGDWDLVREALVWLGQPDPADTMHVVRADDPSRSVAAEVMDLWWALFGPTLVSPSAVVAGIADGVGDTTAGRLRELLASVCQGGRLNPGGLQSWVRRRAGKVVGGRRFVRHEDGQRGTLVMLETRRREDPRPEEVAF